jgi:glutathione peroxidase
MADDEVAPAAAAAAVEEESMSSITARATNLSRDAGDRAAFTAITNGSGDIRTAYDFDLPIEGVSIPFRDIIRQNVDEEGRTRCKVILVSNMKEDDPVARKDIPEFIALATKYGRNGEFAVIMTPTDQGYYEPDTSQLVRLKLESEYGYGINPSTVVTDKIDILGKRALPFWRWMQSNCRTPAGLGRVEANFEKFLIDGRTGIPIRRYPRKYKPTNMKNDIEAILAGRPLPPAGANFLEEWRTAAVAAEADTYRFQKGLNYYD